MSPTAEPEVIQGAYRALMRKYHPDASGGAYSDARAKRINEAYATLSDPGLRAAYDALLRAANSPPPPQEPRPSAAPRAPEESFAQAAPLHEAERTRTPMSWRLTALVTVVLAVAGFATGRLLKVTPPRQVEAIAEPGPKAPAATSPHGMAKTGRAVATSRAVTPSRAVAAIVSDDIVPRWRPDCSAGGEPVVVDVQVNLAPDGSLVSARVAGGSGDPAQLPAAKESARQAVAQAAPFVLPPESYKQWRVFIVRFDTRDVCATRVAGEAGGRPR